LVEQAGAGWVVAPQDAAAMTDAILHAKANPAEARARAIAGRSFVEAHFDRRALADRYLDELVALVG
jgi:glycosyltransferase involved in cell wall biosynthesis